jgi:Tol biopolymer transport system component
MTVLQSAGVALLPPGFSHRPCTVITAASGATLDVSLGAVAAAGVEAVPWDFAGAVGRFSSFSYTHPRWSPDDHSIAYEHASTNWADDIYVLPAAGGEPRQVTRDGVLINGLAWLPDGSGVVYSSARGSTTLYLPVMHLWSQPLDGSPARQLTFGDAGYDHPDVGRDGRVVVARWRMQFDIWKFPVEGDALENARRGVRITAQTGQVQTPTIAPDESQVAFLSDSGGHGNIWIKDLKTGEGRQVTHDHDPATIMGVPIWSPDGSIIAFASNRHLGNGTDVGYWTVHPDGSDLRDALPRGAWATWSPDGRWLYYAQESPTKTAARFDIMKVAAAGGAPQTVRTEGGAIDRGIEALRIAGGRRHGSDGPSAEVRTVDVPTLAVRRAKCERALLRPAAQRGRAAPDLARTASGEFA